MGEDERILKNDEALNLREKAQKLYVDTLYKVAKEPEIKINIFEKAWWFFNTKKRNIGIGLLATGEVLGGVAATAVAAPYVTIAGLALSVLGIFHDALKKDVKSREETGKGSLANVLDSAGDFLNELAKLFRKEEKGEKDNG